MTSSWWDENGSERLLCCCTVGASALPNPGKPGQAEGHGAALGYLQLEGGSHQGQAAERRME